jgi:hypothetical protein
VTSTRALCEVTEREREFMDLDEARSRIGEGIVYHPRHGGSAPAGRPTPRDWNSPAPTAPTKNGHANASL